MLYEVITSWKIAAFQFIAIFVRFAGWYFFFKIADMIALKEEHAELAQVENVGSDFNPVPEESN